MHNTKPCNGLAPEDTYKNHLSTVNKTSLQQYKASLESSSNTLSSILLKDVWNTHLEQYNEMATSRISTAVGNLLQNNNTSNVKTWKSNLSNLTDPEILFERSIPSCITCSSNSENTSLAQFMKTDCKCNIPVIDTKRTEKGNIPDKSDNGSIFVKTLNVESSSLETKSSEDQRLFKPKFGRPKHVKNQPGVSRLPLSQDMEVDLTREEEENKSHKANVARITFKTAKEQLLASNPAAKRTLGTSRKAQAKFVSPMIGAQ